MKILENYNLLSLNTFGLDVSAKFFTELSSETDLEEVLSDEVFRSTKKMILGGGSNILFTGNFDGLVLKNSFPGIKIIEEEYEHALVKAGAGEVWHSFVLWSIDRQLGGIENLSLIPGLVGAAPMQNIGAYGVEIKDVFHSLEAIDMKSGEKVVMKKEDCRFGYRESIFKNKYKGQFIITSVTFRLNKFPVFNISYGDIKKTLEEMNIKDMTLKAVSDAVIKIRTSKLPDPKALGNAGSFFKNPEIPLSHFEKLKISYPEMPNYLQAADKLKISAAWLIEQCGWKGKVIGRTGSHAKQALVLLNYGGAKGSEILKLAEDIIASVKAKFDIQLQPEVNVI